MFETPTIKSIHEYSEALKIERRTARWLGRPLRKRCVDISLELMFTRILTNGSHLVSMANYRKIFWTHSSSQAEQVNGDHFANCLRVMGHLPVWEAPSIFKSPNKHSPDFRELQLLTDFRLGPATFQRVNTVWNPHGWTLSTEIEISPPLRGHKNWRVRILWSHNRLW